MVTAATPPGSARAGRRAAGHNGFLSVTLASRRLRWLTARTYGAAPRLASSE